MEKIRIAAAQYAIELLEHWSNYEAHLRQLVGRATADDANLLLLPEYSAMTLTGQLPTAVRSDLHLSIRQMQPLIDRWLQLCESLAQEHQIWFCPGTAPVLDSDGRFRNRSWMFGPQGLLGTQDKLIMTRFEREQWHIDSGQGLQLFDLPFGRLGIQICYDNEFPHFARQLTEAGADLILSPSCTDTRAGYYRVRRGCQARALENQIAMIQSPTTGLAEWSPAVDENIGRAGVFVPPDYGMPSDGVLAESPLEHSNESHWLMTELNLAELRSVREQGQVLTRRDWPEQFDGRAELKPAVAGSA